MTTSGATVERSTFPDVLRTIAIFAVVGNHLTWAYGPGDYNGSGTWGVDCFFVLSGYLLAGPYLRAILDPNAALPSMRRFYRRRFLRIYPLYAACVLFTAIPAMFLDPNVIPDIITHLTMTHGLFYAFATPWWNAPLWTMSVDTQFYLVLPLVAAGLVRICRGRPVAVRRSVLFGVLGAIVVAALLERVLVGRFVHDALVQRSVWTVAGRNLVGVGGAFALGSAVALIERLHGIPSRARARLVGGCGIVLSFVVIGAPDMNGAYRIAEDTIGATAAALLLYGFGARFQREAASSEPPVFRFFADHAYAIYLFHRPMLIFAFTLLKGRVTFGSPGGGLILTVATLAGTFPVAVLAHALIERPFLRLKDRERGIRTPTPLPASGA